MSIPTRTVSHWGTYRVVDDGDGLRALDDPADPHPSPLAHGLPATLRDRTRIDRPYVREGWLRSRGASRAARGTEAFVPVSWDRACELVADALTEARQAHGHESVYGGSYGWASAGRLHHAPSVLKRFLGLGGGYVDKAGNHSFGAAMTIAPYVIGRGDIAHLVARWPEMVGNTRLLVLFGGAAPKNGQNDSGGAVGHETPDRFAQLAAAGVEIVCVGPSREDSPVAAAEWLPIRPNTDTALMLALAHTLVAAGRADRAFLDRFCAGSGEFLRYLRGDDVHGRPRSARVPLAPLGGDGVAKDARWASDICGVPAEAIERLAHRMADTRTLVNTSWSVQRAHHGEQPIWATVALAAVLGQIGLPGGGFALGLGAVSNLSSVRPDGIPRPTLDLGPNPVGIAVPVGRAADMFLNPGTVIRHDGRELRLPRIEVVHSAGGNPFHHNTNLNRFVEAWRRPGTVIVHEPWWSPPARFADIVLPSTTTLERNDVAATDHSRHWLAMPKAAAPYAQCRNDFDVFSELADRLGFGPEYHCDRDESAWLRAMYDRARARAADAGFDVPYGFDEFWDRGSVEFGSADADRPPLLSQFRADPEAYPLGTPSGRIELVSETIRGFALPDCPPRPTWLEPAEWLGGAGAQRHPLHLLSGQPAHRLHSQLDNAPLSRASKIAGREPVTLHPDDAAARGIADGDVVRVFNDRGAFLAGARLADPDTLLPGVVRMATGAWYDPGPDGTCKHGNPNAVTSDRGSSELGQMPTAQTCLVDVEPCPDAAPVTAFEPPETREPGMIDG